MKAIRIVPGSRRVDLVDGDIDELIREQVEPPSGLVDLGPGLGMVACLTGCFGSSADLFWFHRTGEAFGGVSFVVALGSDKRIADLPASEWIQVVRNIDFLGRGDEALPRLRLLISGQIQFDNADSRQGELKLH